MKEPARSSYQINISELLLDFVAARALSRSPLVRLTMRPLILLCLLSIFQLSCSSTLSLRENSRLFRRQEERKIWLLFNVDVESHDILPDGRTAFFMHTSLYITGTDWEGPLKIDIAMDKELVEDTDMGLHLRILDKGVESSGEPLVTEGGRIAKEVGTTTERNLWFYDAVGKEGFLLETFRRDMNYRTGEQFRGAINDCNVYVKRCLNGMGITLLPEIEEMFNAAWAYQTRIETEPIAIEIKDVVKINYEVNNGVREADTSYYRANPNCKRRKGKRAGNCQVWEESRPSKKGSPISQNELALDPAGKNAAKERLELNPENEFVKGEVPKDAPKVYKDTGGSIAIARIEGTVKSAMTVSKDAWKALGVAGIAAGVAIVVLDFVDQNWAGAAWGLVGLAVGAAAGVAASAAGGLVGSIVGGLITLFFSSKFISDSCSLYDRKGVSKDTATLT